MTTHACYIDHGQTPVEILDYGAWPVKDAYGDITGAVNRVYVRTLEDWACFWVDAKDVIIVPEDLADLHIESPQQIRSWLFGWN